MYLASLVEEEVFDEIVVSFLPVGHTHEDVDQMFSRFAVALRNEDAKTLDSLLTRFVQPDPGHRGWSASDVGLPLMVVGG